MKLFKKSVGIVISLALAAAMLMPVGVLAADEIPKVTLSVGKGQDTPVYTAEETNKTLSLNVDNQGSGDAKNIKITPIIDDPSAWPFEIDKMNNEVSVADIPAGQSVEKAAEWGPLTVRSDVETKSYRLDFVITWDDGEKQYQAIKYIYVKAKAKPAPEQPAQEEQPAEPETPDAGMEGFSNSEPVFSGGKETGTASVPRVIVTGFSTEPGEVSAGGNFKLIVHLKNTSTKTAVSNLLFDLQAPSSGSETAAEASGIFAFLRFSSPFTWTAFRQAGQEIFP
ncbi:MAG: hypothetical protein QM793_06840 [Muricomes sp.]